MCSVVLANATAPAGSNNTGGTQLEQPQQLTGTPGSPVAAPVAGSNMTTTPMAQPQGPGIVISQNGQNQTIVLPSLVEPDRAVHILTGDGPGSGGHI